MWKLERVSFCIELKFLNGKCTFVQRERNASGRRYTLVFSMIYDSASVFTERRIQDIVTMNNFTGPFFSFFFFYFGLFLFHNCTRCLFCVRSVLFFLKCYHSSCPFVWGTIAQSGVSNILRINSFTPWSNQFVIYPYHLDTLSSRKMMWRIKKKLSISAYCLNWHQELWSKIRAQSLFNAGGGGGILAVAIKFTRSPMRPVVF